MKVTYAPIVSSASGRFGGMVATRWKGIGMFRRFASPSNPNTTAQQDIRNIFKNTTRCWTLMSTEWKAAWDTFATGKAFIGRNKWVGNNVQALNGEVDLDELVFTPGDASTVPPASMVITSPGVDDLLLTVVAPAIPTGWTLQAIVGVCVLGNNWDTLRGYDQFDIGEAEDLVAPYAINLGARAFSATTYRCGAFIRWLDPAGVTRYSSFISGDGTPTP